MLENFSWQQFLVAASVFTLTWYLVVVLLFYRKVFFGLLFSGRGGGFSEVLPHRWDNGVEDLDASVLEQESLMGASKLPDGMSHTTTDAFGFAGDPADSKIEQIGLVPDVLQELKAVFSELSERDGSKREFLEMMGRVRELFPGLGSSPSIARINRFISEHAPFHLSAEELEDLWV